MKLIREFDDFDWIRDTTPNFDENNTPRVGDVLVCLPGYHNSPSDPYHNELEDPNCAGAGYAEGRIIVVKEVDVLPNGPEGKRIVVWPNEDESQMYWDYDDGELCFDCGVYGFALTYYTETLNESDDDFDWANNTLINPWELGYDLVFFDKVPTRKDVEELIDMALTSLNLNRHSKKGWLKTDTRNAIIRKIINRANLSNKGVYLIYYENMGRLLWGSGPIKEEHNEINKVNYSNLVETNLTESDDEWAWTKDPINPWLEYDGIIFDIEPRRDEVNEYIEMALRSRDDIVNKDSWTVGRENDINDIINYQKKYNHCILGVDNTSSLTYGTNYSNRRLVNYSQLIGMEPLMESDDPLQWIRDIQPTIFKDAVIGQTYDITTTRNLWDAIKACSDDEEIYLSKRAKVVRKDNLPYGDVFCGHYRDDIVPVLLLKFLDEDGWDIAPFWVTEDMVQLH